jgi:hypothetical protein
MNRQEALEAFDKPWVCKSCGLRFKFKYVMIDHRNETHLH